MHPTYEMSSVKRFQETERADWKRRVRACVRAFEPMASNGTDRRARQWQQLEVSVSLMDSATALPSQNHLHFLLLVTEEETWRRRRRRRHCASFCDLSSIEPSHSGQPRVPNKAIAVGGDFNRTTAMPDACGPKRSRPPLCAADAGASDLEIDSMQRKRAEFTDKWFSSLQSVHTSDEGLKGVRRGPRGGGHSV